MLLEPNVFQGISNRFVTIIKLKIAMTCDKTAAKWGEEQVRTHLRKKPCKFSSKLVKLIERFLQRFDEQKFMK